MNDVAAGIFLSGLFLGSGPCLANCGPLLAAYITGTNKNVRQSISAYLVFSLSRIAVYGILGLLFFYFGQLAAEEFFSAYRGYIFIAAGIFISVTGFLVILGKGPHNRLCDRLSGSLIHKGNKAIVLIGLVTGVSPCLPLLSVLSYIGLVSKSWQSSLFYGFLFGLGTTFSVLFILSVSCGLIPGFLKGRPGILSVINRVCGLILVLLGLQIILRGIR
ncbi:MAG: sulfite exporter TauE/SafE family protein [Candidatus Omnitrophica bacterium]|jgi:sulfite exporter TauE/SafE|nr:sulfite exporter TauE/SafE family protein [Candidatus Omnitrophota bacterium]MDD5078950.1 sulfite exporter TauE/SafE family protein [Candidatus Omnitrophota bacterium]